MKRTELIYDYPEELVATKPLVDYRCMLWRASEPSEASEIKPNQVLELFRTGDILVVNDTKVLRRRVFTGDGLEILFTKALSELEWEVLFPAKKTKVGQSVPLPGGRSMELTQKGLPQKIKTDEPLTEDYFEEFGELALPPYIQKARGERKMLSEDVDWYQTAWAENSGSCAAPTASLHFSDRDLKALESRGVKVLKVTLHVGLGTFLPIKVDDLSEHKMHSEWGYISKPVKDILVKAKVNGQKIWALGTTATRVLESWADGKLCEQSDGSLSGNTDLFIKPGFEFKMVDVLMTNFHQPESTLLALVSAFAGRENVFKVYQKAINSQFRLFSYGDLSIWMK